MGVAGTESEAQQPFGRWPPSLQWRGGGTTYAKRSVQQCGTRPWEAREANVHYIHWFPLLMALEEKVSRRRERSAHKAFPIS